MIHRENLPTILKPDTERDALTTLATHMDTAPLYKDGAWSIDGPDGTIVVDFRHRGFRVKFRKRSKRRRDQDYARDIRHMDAARGVKKLNDREYVVHVITDEAVKALKSALGYNSAKRASMEVAASREAAQNSKKRRCKYKDTSGLEVVKNQQSPNMDKLKETA